MPSRAQAVCAHSTCLRQPEVRLCPRPVVPPPLDDAAVQLDLAAAPAHLQRTRSRRGSQKKGCLGIHPPSLASTSAHIHTHTPSCPAKPPPPRATFWAAMKRCSSSSQSRLRSTVLAEKQASSSASRAAAASARRGRRPPLPPPLQLPSRWRVARRGCSADARGSARRMQYPTAVPEGTKKKAAAGGVMDSLSATTASGNSTTDGVAALHAIQSVLSSARTRGEVQQALADESAHVEQ